MKEFDINPMFTGKRKGEFYYNENEFTKHIVHLLIKLFEDNQFDYTFREFYDMGIELSGIPSKGNFVIESIKFNYIIGEYYLDEEEDNDGEELLEFLETNSDYELFSVPHHLQFNLLNFKEFDSNLFLGKFQKVGFQLYFNHEKGKKLDSLCLRPKLPFYFDFYH